MASETKKENELERVIKEIKAADTLEKKEAVVTKLIKEIKDEELKKSLKKVLKIIQDLILGREVSLERMMDVPFQIPIFPAPKAVRTREGAMEELEKEKTKKEEEKPVSYKPVGYATRISYSAKQEEEKKEEFGYSPKKDSEKGYITKTSSETIVGKPLFRLNKPEDRLIIEKQETKQKDYIEKPVFEDYKRKEKKIRRFGEVEW